MDTETGNSASLLVTWELEGNPVAVDLAIGPTPDHLDHRHETTVRLLVGPAGAWPLLGAGGFSSPSPPTDRARPW